MIRIKLWIEFYKRRLEKRRHEIKERDRRDAVQSEDVNIVLRSRYVSKCMRDMHLMIEHPGPARMRGYGEVLFTILTFENAQRRSAVRGMLVEEVKVAEKAKKGFYVIRERIAGHVVGCQVCK
ncbi:unnamed protein product [Clavelina lepadiformis]|uniref:Uncharacterized protein n=1 Tax=Clavelina lepadiformis TaxID=159417 RepID=A0ABP0G7A9_CLALP